MKLVVPIVMIGAVLCGGAASADLTETRWTVTGWEPQSGSWTGSVLVFESQTPAGDDFALTGFFDWIFESSGEYHGRELFTGTLTAEGSLTLQGVKLLCTGPLEKQTYTAELTPDGELVNGTWLPNGGTWSAVPSCDLTQDDTVDFDDLRMVLDEWGLCPGTCPLLCAADLNADSTVDIDDLLIVLAAWGPCE